MSLGFPVLVYGLGNMGGALAKCLRRAYPDATLFGFDADPAKVDQFVREGVLKAFSESDRFESGAVVLAVKPQILEQVAKGLQSRIGTEVSLVSILAGVPVARLRTAFGRPKIVRVMPNLALTVGAGASAFATDGLTSADLALAHALLDPTGEVVEVLESQLDAVTGLSGSGPAYVLKFLLSLEDGGVLAGLPRPVAHRLAAATVSGTLRMAQESGLGWDDLRGQVTSPGGTTIHGLKALEDNGFAAAVMAAVQAATDRSKELGK
jgi:pyrroline-5-carboxylate reductase